MKRRECVPVSATTETLKTQDASLGEVVELRSIKDLPLTGRMPLDLVLTIRTAPACGSFGPGKAVAALPDTQRIRGDARQPGGGPDRIGHCVHSPIKILSRTSIVQCPILSVFALILA